MKTSEWLVMIAGFSGIICMFLKMPKMICELSSRQLSPRAQFISRCGTVMIVLFPALLIIAMSYRLALEDTEAAISTRPEGVKWMLFAFITSGFMLMYVMFLGLVYSLLRDLNKLFSGCGEILKSILDVAFKFGFTQFKSTSAKGSKGSKSFFYKAGEDFTKGATENIPGDEWKYPKEDDEDKNPPDSGPKNRWN